MFTFFYKIKSKSDFPFRVEIIQTPFGETVHVAELAEVLMLN